MTGNDDLMAEYKWKIKCLHSPKGFHKNYTRHRADMRQEKVIFVRIFVLSDNSLQNPKNNQHKQRKYESKA